MEEPGKCRRCGVEFLPRGPVVFTCPECVSKARSAARRRTTSGKPAGPRRRAEAESAEELAEIEEFLERESRREWRIEE